MNIVCRWLGGWKLTVLFLIVVTRSAAGEEWITLLDAEQNSLSAWREPQQGWRLVGDATLPPAPGKRLVGVPGQGVAINSGREPVDLVSREEFTDVELRLEFMLARDSNSGVKLNGLYEIQFLDTAGAEPTTGNMCGGVYPRLAGSAHVHLSRQGHSAARELRQAGRRVADVRTRVPFAAL